MASPEELIPSLPDTLPEDFGEWDSEGAATAAAVESGEWETAHALSEAPKAFGQSADSDEMPASLVDSLRNSGSPSSGPFTGKQEQDLSNGKSEAAPTAKTLSSREEWEAWIESHSFNEAPKPFGKTAQRDDAPASSVEKPRGSGSSSSGSGSAPEIAKQQKDSSNGNGKPSPASKPAQTGEWENWVAAHSSGKTPKSNGRSSDPKTTLSPAAEKPRYSSSASSVLVAEPETTSKPTARASRPASSNPVLSSPAPASPASSSIVSLGLGVTRATDAVPAAVGMTAVVEADEIVHSPEPTATLRREADAALSKLYSSRDVEVEEAPKPTNKKWIIVGGASAGTVLIAIVLMMTVFHHGTPAAKPSVQTVPAQADPQVETPAPDPSASVPVTPSAPAAATQKPQAANSQNSATDNSVKSPKTPTKSQAKMMGDQLNAPTQIEKQAAEVAPPSMSFDAAGADGLGGSGANASVLNGHAQPVVKFVPPKPIAVSSGVATGLLIQRTPPVYPSIAKAARVGGTVELHATISKNGTIKDVHVVSGPAMLQQAAVEAVRNWRYRPYTLNNEPIEVETSVSVVFSLDK
jgi:periplasmic protein TonB